MCVCVCARVAKWVLKKKIFNPCTREYARHFIYKQITEKHKHWIHFCRESDHRLIHHSPELPLVILTTPGMIFAFVRINFVGTLCSCLFLTLDLVALTKSSSSSSSEEEPMPSEKLSDSEQLQLASCCRSSSLRLITCSIAGVIGYE